MQKIIYDAWNVVMNHNINPLKNIPHTHVRHLVMQLLALMWCVAFSMYFTSIWLFGITTVAHVILLGAVAFTVLTFETAKENLDFLEVIIHLAEVVQYT